MRDPMHNLPRLLSTNPLSSFNASIQRNEPLTLMYCAFSENPRELQSFEPSSRIIIFPAIRTVLSLIKYFLITFFNSTFKFWKTFLPIQRNDQQSAQLNVGLFFSATSLTCRTTFQTYCSLIDPLYCLFVIVAQRALLNTLLKTHLK